MENPSKLSNGRSRVGNVLDDEERQYTGERTVGEGQPPTKIGLNKRHTAVTRGDLQHAR